MALHLFSVRGCEHKAFSTSSEKEAETKSFVSHRFVNLKTAKDLEAVAVSIDFIHFNKTD